MNWKYCLRITSHFLIAVLCAFIIASLMHSQFVLSELAEVGVIINLSDQISMTIDDLLGLLPTYGTIIGLSFLFAFSITFILKKYAKINFPWLYPLAGGVAIFAALTAMHPIMDITIIAGARTNMGMLCQCLAGIFGGWVFAHLRKAD